ncbi:unnamed protein product, partial [Rotaria sordida]
MSAIHQCYRQILLNEIKRKKRQLNHAYKLSGNLRNSVQYDLDEWHFIRMQTIFQQLINENIFKWNTVHHNKLVSLRNEYNQQGQQSNSTSINPIRNYSHRILTDDEHSALVNGLDFVYRNSSFDEKSFISNVENLFVSLLGRCTDKFDWEEREATEKTVYNLTPEQLQYAAKLRSISDRFKRQAKHELRSYGKVHKNSLLVLKKLGKDNSIHITTPDKGKGVVILDQQDYVNKMLDILNDTTTFEPIDEDPTIKKEDRLTRILQRMTKRGFLSKNEYDLARPRGSYCARMYGLPKIHKEGVPMRPVISSIGSYNYRLAKVLATRLEPLRHNQYILRDTFDFIESLQKLNTNMTKH